jgi:crossover junction endodeoxyribonuclease RusA
VQNKKLKPWRALALVAAVDAKVAREEAGDRGLLPAAVFVRARFYYSRPASHYGTGRNAGVLKPNAPVYKESKPDTDNLQKAVGDVLTQAGIIRDDVKVVHWDAAKMWSDHDRVEVSIWSL